MGRGHLNGDLKAKKEPTVQNSRVSVLDPALILGHFLIRQNKIYFTCGSIAKPGSVRTPECTSEGLLTQDTVGIIIPKC